MRYGSFILFLFLITGIINPLQAQVNKAEQNFSRTLSLFADGNVQNVIDSPGESSTATGVLGVGIYNQFTSFSLYVSAVGTGDKIESGFGSSILGGNSGGSFSGFGINGRWTPKKFMDVWWGPAFNLQAISSTWVNGQEEVNTSVRSASFQFLVEYRDSFGELNENPLSLSGDIGITHRSLGGDLAGSDRKDFRENILGVDKSSWTGLEIGLTIQLHQITARGAYVQFFGDDIDGLTGGQILTTISVKSSILSDKK